MLLDDGLTPQEIADANNEIRIIELLRATEKVISDSKNFRENQREILGVILNGE